MKKYHIKLAADERKELSAITKKQKVNAQNIFPLSVVLQTN